MSVTQLFKALGWAMYLGCSWTWCIGLFLPGILLRDFGWPSWLVFVIPNVIGAAAMGFVFSDGMASQRFVARHRPACLVFSVVTILFQIYFLLWAAAMIRPPLALVCGLWLLLLVLYVLSRPQAAGGLVLPGLVFVVSLLGMIWFARDLPVSKAYLSDPAFGMQAPQLTLLIPVFLFGFIFSPYLDLTFHHVTQQTSPALTKASFALGFGLFFFTLMIFTLLYAPSVIAMFFNLPETQDAPFQLAHRAGLRLLLFVHFTLQAGFTAVLHLCRLKRLGEKTVRGEVVFMLLVAVAALVLLALGHNRMVWGLSGYELIYRVFMAFYGLLAPAYIWICVIPFQTLGLNRNLDWGLCGGAICLALPLFAWSFLAQEYRALNPGLCFVLVAPFFRGLYYRWTPDPCHGSR